MPSPARTARAALRPPSRVRITLVAAIVVSVAACTTAGGDPEATGLGAAAAGVCEAIAALPDRDAAARAFQNVAHDELHALAADARLDRAAAASVLESMQAVEADIGGSADATVVRDDLATLLAAADDALRAIDVPDPACTR